MAATILRIPITHLHGGELTYGAYDDSIRHSIANYLIFIFQFIKYINKD